MNELFTNEKHYITLNNYLRQQYHKKVFKISLNGNFSCPNRDGTISNIGCLFCSSKGSGDFAGDKNLSIPEQFNNVLDIMSKKWHDGLYIAYFQANTNTYGSLDELKKRYDQLFINGRLINDKIKILSIATRPDCINDEICEYLKNLNKKVTIWIELGFQTANEKTAVLMNRGYTNDIFINACNKLKKAGLTVIVHIINGLPNDKRSDMLDTITFLNKLPIDGIKIHMLHIISDSPLGHAYLQKPFSLLTIDEYVDIVTAQIRMLKPNIVIHRITGDADKNNLIAPTWTLKKFVVMNEIDKLMRLNNYYQGDLYV